MFLAKVHEVDLLAFQFAKVVLASNCSDLEDLLEFGEALKYFNEVLILKGEHFLFVLRVLLWVVVVLVAHLEDVADVAEVATLV